MRSSRTRANRRFRSGSAARPGVVSWSSSSPRVGPRLRMPDAGAPVMVAVRPIRADGIGPDYVHDVGALEVGPGEVGLGEISVLQVGAVEVGPGEVGLGEISVL